MENEKVDCPNCGAFTDSDDLIECSLCGQPGCEECQFDDGEGGAICKDKDVCLERQEENEYDS